jgi:erythromycin esterase-like protein
MRLLTLYRTALLIICTLISTTIYGDELLNHIKSKAIKLHTSACLNPLIESAAGKKLVLLGEASHGTHEYYTWRDSISRRLITEHGFNFIAVEGDFASLFEINRFVKDLPGAAKSAEEAMSGLNRWPEWMWGNHEVLGLVKWLRSHNDRLPQDQKIGFYGMDLYDEWRSKEVLLELSLETDPELHKLVMEQLKCFALYWGDSWAYANDVRKTGIDCSASTEELVNLLLQHQPDIEKVSDYDFFYAIQNAHVINNAEKFYRKSAAGMSAAAWNARVFHMHNTLLRLLQVYGQHSKGIVWAHNTHIGDAHYTEMKNYGQTNIGELTRKHFGIGQVSLIGFTTYKGSVLAGAQWGGARQVMKVSEAPQKSLEGILKRTGIESFYMLFEYEDRGHKDFMKPLGNRAIGVIYNPQYDSRQYVQTIVPMRYDALIFFYNTTELKPLRR